MKDWSRGTALSAMLNAEIAPSIGTQAIPFRSLTLISSFRDRGYTDVIGRTVAVNRMAN